MSSFETPKRLEILGLVFPGFNILDLTGPTEVFGNSAIPPESRHISIASATELTSAHENITLKRDLSFENVDVAKYDIVLIPGAAPKYISQTLANDAGLLKIVRAFAEQGDGEGRWLFSVCTGAGFLGAAGILEGKRATTHWGFLEDLDNICGGKTEVVRKRWIDCGRSQGSARVVTAGGVSCGIDAALWIAGEVYGQEKAVQIAEGMDHPWKFENTQVKATEGWEV